MTFAIVLRGFREAARLSQARIAEAAGMDHSLVSRYEAGTRQPTRETVLRLATGLSLTETQTDALLAAAGFMPMRVSSLLAVEPLLGEALAVLRNERIHPDVRDDLRSLLAVAIRQAQRVELLDAHDERTAA